jgi:hypothetical protein|tara:strand:- start:18 stop:545 length:528 start_codon:yes stop_codon:yes gene_type:complete
MDLIKFQSKIDKYIISHNYNLKDSLSETTVNNMLNKVFNNLNTNSNQNGGNIILPSEFFGKESGAYVESNEGSPVVTDDTIRAPLEQTNFPLDGGACPTCTLGNYNNNYSFFTQKDINNLNKAGMISVTRNNYKNATELLNQNLKNMLHSTFESVKNKNNTIGKVHFQKVLKNFN